MTQIERLKQAKAWLEQLSQGLDPVTGEPLPDDSAAREETAKREFDSSKDYIDAMLEEDTPGLAPRGGRRRVSQLRGDLVLYRVWNAQHMAQGRHPETDALLDPKDPLGRGELRTCFAFVARALENALLAGYVTAKAPFSLPRGTVLPISPGPVELAGLLDRINALREDATAVRALTPDTLEPYLASQGLLAEAPRKEGRKAYLSAPGGEALGLTKETRTGPGGRTYATLIFSPQAQQYVADHLDDLAAYLADPSRWEPSREGRPLRQIDVLKRAKDYLDALSRGTDPLTGKSLAGPSAAGEESVRRFLASCVQDLSYMILRDEPQLLPNGSHRVSFYFSLKNAESNPKIKSRDAIAASILRIERLAWGCHPDTGASLDSADPLNQERLGKCFAFVGTCLRNTYIANQYTAMVPFELSPEDREKILVAQTPVSFSGLASRINAQIRDKTAMRGIDTKTVYPYLASESLLKLNGSEYQPTPAGESLGIRMERFDPPGRASYITMALSAEAQQYVIDHLGDILAIQRDYDARSVERLEERLDALEQQLRQPPAQEAAAQESKEAKPAVQAGGEEEHLRQVDILKHAHTYLEQLSDYVDPIARKSLPKGSAARDDSVHKLIAFCRGDLKKMIDYDDPELDSAGRNPSHISKQDRVIRKARLRGLERLSQGCHPDTGAPLDPQDPLGREELRRCFAFVAQCLRNTLNAGYFTAKAPFALSPEARSRVPISAKEPISLPELVKTISAQREDDTAMRGLRIEAVTEYLFSQGLLTRFLDGEQTHTPKGEAQGFVCTKLLKADAPCYDDVLCAPAAQQYVVDHLDDISAARWTQVDPAVAGQPIPQDVDDQARALSDAFRQAGGPEERQADALVRAKGYLEQLHDYTDPLTGEYLTGDQTVRNAGVNRLFFSCVQALEKMIAYDSGVKKSVSSLKDLAFWQQRAQGMERLARGCHPDTGADLDPKDPLTQEGLRGCFAFVARCLYRALNNGFFSARVPFSLPPEARPNSPFSQEPIGVMDLIKAINVRREDETAVRSLSPQTLLGYLASQGLLTASPGRRGNKKYDLSPRSEEMGISQKEDTWDGVPYMQIVYGPKAQRYVIDHLDDIIAFRAKK